VTLFPREENLGNVEGSADLIVLW